MNNHEITLLNSVRANQRRAPDVLALAEMLACWLPPEHFSTFRDMIEGFACEGAGGEVTLNVFYDALNAVDVTADEDGIAALLHDLDLCPAH